MDYRNEIDKNFNKILDQTAIGLSKILKSIGNREDRIEALRRIYKENSEKLLLRIHKIALEQEDYEMCDAVSELFKEKGIKFKKKS